MTKLQRMDADMNATGNEPEHDDNTMVLTNGTIVETLADFSKKITIPATLQPGGLVVVFRDPSHEDLEFFETQMKTAETRLEAVKRFGVRLCIQWGDKNGVTVPQWDKLRGIVSVTLAKVLDDFFPNVQAAEGIVS
ncbi:MAG: hypothetical protein HC781_06355 [Leptolyngbyaceae cyanobacterium CSU_1_4]|nr:hypothetical protein [Leptolyngbyaceae cyanobacterium CSU_1_4]